MINALSQSLAGLQTASKQVNQAAENVVNATTPGLGEDINLPEEIVKLTLSEAAYKANLKTIAVTNALADELLHIFDEEV